MEHDIYALGDEAVVVRLGNEINLQTHRQVRALLSLLADNKLPCVTEIVPAFASVTLFYDVACARSHAMRIGTSVLDFYCAQVKAIIAQLPRAADTSDGERRIVEIPVCYEAEFALDLARVMASTELSSEQIIELHTAAEYRVYMIGFSPGFAYLGGLDERLATPRLAAPRVRVEPGSVGIGGSQTGVYPLASPGGWNLIGRTPLNLFDFNCTPPSLLRAGDGVRFTSIGREEFARLK